MSAPSRDRFTGRLLLRGDPGYEQARTGRIFNARRPARFPAAVLLAENDDDVSEGVRLAAERGWTVSVRSGGHSWAAWSLRDDALLIDLGRLRDIAYEPGTGIVSVRPAVTGGTELAPFLAARGRAFPGGHCASVGLGGYLLQGGQGWDGRARGWACQSVVGVDVVTADGRLVHADADEQADLLWAARGAGPGFPGVVTRFRLQTYRAPGAMWHDTWTFRLDDAVELLAWLQSVLPGLDRRVEPVVAATRLPDVPLRDGAARPGGTVLLLHTTAMAGSDAEALALLSPLQDGPLAARALGHARGPTSVAEENLAQTAQNPEGYRYAVDCTWTDAPASVLAPKLQAHWGELDTEHSFSIWYGWAPRRDLPDMAFSVEADVYIATYAIYADPGDDDRYAEWVHSQTAALAAHGTGAYLGDTDFTRRQDRFLSDDAYRRLGQIRARRDPSGRFGSYLTADPGGLNVHG
ncbi:MAG TPA: FAD-binding oxidoreductase [Streptosporangiaceae bacterium]|nr:FAD-binding oxidoreductase [Streptosporangiaceae bacterium]